MGPSDRCVGAGVGNTTGKICKVQEKYHSQDMMCVIRL
jgi:hypothetical protein